MFDEGTRAALSYFRAVETDPMTDEANQLAGDLVEEYGEVQSCAASLWSRLSCGMRFEAMPNASAATAVRTHGSRKWSRTPRWGRTTMVEIPRACISCGRPIPNQAHAPWCPRGRAAWARRPKANQTAYAGDWEQIRLQVLERDGYKCQLGFPGCLGKATEVDHILGVAENGSNELANCRSACRRCHATRTGQQGARAANAKRRKQRG